VRHYTVLAARDGEDALEIADWHSGAIRLLLGDMIMPKMNGGDLAGRLKMTRPDIRVAFMSGYSEFSRAEMGQQFPDAPVLPKPFSPASLAGIIREALASASSSRPVRTIGSSGKEYAGPR
jgi:two-component system, cell cycle sensor histidine kinase and response regulator CckA